MPRTFVLSGWGIKPSVLNAPKNYTFETYEYVKKHIQQQHCTVKLIGFSLGAQQALQISQMFPKKISSLHLISWRAFFKENELIRGDTSETTELFVANPFSKDGKTEMLKVRNQNARTGETVVSGKIIKEIDRQFE